MTPKPGYAAGNILNMLVHLGADLTGCDFSGLSVWQAYLQGVELQDVNFSDTDLRDSRFKENFGRVYRVRYSPNGKFLAVAAGKHEVRLWRIHDRTLICKFNIQANTVAFSSDGNMLFTGGDDALIYMWDIQTGCCVKKLEGHTGSIHSLASSEDGRILASGGDITVRLWEAAIGACQSIEIPNDVFSVAVSRDGSLLAIAIEDETIQIRSVESREILHTLHGHSHAIWNLAFSPHGDIVASGSYDETIRLWDVHTGGCIIVLHEHTAYVREITFSPCGNFLASTSDDRTVKLWHIPTGKCVNTFIGHMGQVFSVAFSPNGSMLTSGGGDQTVRIWDVYTGKCTNSLQGFIHPTWVHAFNPDGSMLSGVDGNAGYVWDVRSGQRISIWSCPTNQVRQSAFHATGAIFISTDKDQTTRIWQMNTGVCLTILSEHRGRLRSFALNSDLSILATLSDDQTIHLWDLQTCRCIRRLEDNSGGITAIAFNSEGSLMAGGGGRDRTVHLWNMQSGKHLKTLRIAQDLAYPFYINVITFSPNSQMIAVNSGATVIEIRDIQANRTLYILRGHHGNVLSLTFSPDGSLLASGSRDHTVRLWDVTTGEQFKMLQVTRGVTSVIFSPDGHMLAYGSEDGTIKLWHFHTDEHGRIFSTPSPYEGMNITGTTGLTGAQRETLKSLGAVEDEA